MVLRARAVSPTNTTQAVSTTAGYSFLAPKPGEYCQHEDRDYYQETIPGKKESAQSVCLNCSHALTAMAAGISVKLIRKPNPSEEDSTMKAAVAKTNSPTATVAKEKASPAPKKDTAGRTEGKTLKLGVGATWVHIFQKMKTLTDAQITDFMMKEFPERKSKTFEFPAYWRRVYNKGGLTKGVVPSVQSKEFEAPSDKKKEVKHVVKKKVGATKAKK